MFGFPCFVHGAFRVLMFFFEKVWEICHMFFGMHSTFLVLFLLNLTIILWKSICKGYAIHVSSKIRTKLYSIMQP